MPASSDTAYITNAGTYSVTNTATATVNAIIVGRVDTNFIGPMVFTNGIWRYFDTNGNNGGQKYYQARQE